MMLNEEEYKELKSHIVRKDSFLHNVVNNIYQTGMYFIDVEFLRIEDNHYRFFEIKTPLIGRKGLFGFKLVECKTNKEFILQEYDLSGDLQYYIKNDYELLCIYRLNFINNWLDHCI